MNEQKLPFISYIQKPLIIKYWVFNRYLTKQRKINGF